MITTDSLIRILSYVAPKDIICLISGEILFALLRILKKEGLKYINFKSS